MSSRGWHHFHSFILPTTKVPYELLNKKFRAGQKAVDRELNQVGVACSELMNELGEAGVSVEEVGGLLDTVGQKVTCLKRKVSFTTHSLSSPHS